MLFAGQDTHTRLLADAIDAAPGPATPLEAVRAALDALTATFTDDRRDVGARLRPVIAGHTELQERSALKRAKLAEAVTDALHQRGVAEPTASLAAELGIRAFCDAFDQWADPAGKQTLTELTRRTLDELRAALVALD
ncbi:TetR/AcrR family transcriptional regulator [Streptomyces sp. DSM 41524]|uniref:TetR/AcrR family transcriptional regulator n=1 Tax=Streptomyces asiaticus subsp. ignotus TaxID=3098222 RepID=A0ABU7Q5U1_9ACTN|nr:TetR/AcrR family transcriptional regulator [Streptomyces sp. DSM 41524]